MAKIPDAMSLGPGANIRPLTGVARYQPVTGLEGAWGTQLQQSGSDISQAAAFLKDHQDRHDTLMAEDAYTQLQSAGQELKNGEGGYGSIDGKNAIAPDFVQSQMDRFQKQADALSAGLQNDQQREMFTQRRDLARAQFKAGVLAHQAQQSAQFSDNSEKATINVELNNIANAPTDQNQFDMSMARIKSTIKDREQRLGMSPDQAKQLETSTISDAWTNRIQALVDSNPTAASDMLKQHAGEIDATDRASLQKIVDAANLRGASQQKADAIIGSGATPEDMLAQARKITDPKLRDATVRRVQSRIDETNALNAQKDRTVLGNIWAQHQHNPNMTIDDLPAATQAYIEKRNLGPQVDRMMAAGPATDNPRLFLDLMTQAHEHPQEFTKQDLTKFYGQLSHQHQAQLEGAYNAITQQDGKALDSMKIAQQAVSDTKAAIVAAGLNPTPSANAGSGEASDFDKFLVSVHDAITARMQQEGRPLTRDEAAGIARGMLHSATLAGTGIGSWFQTTVPVYEMTPAQKAAPWQIPPDMENTIKAKLRAAGMADSDANVQRYYKLQSGVSQ